MASLEKGKKVANCTMKRAGQFQQHQAFDQNGQQHFFNESVEPKYPPPSLGGATNFSTIPLKDVVIVMFMLCLWFYSIMLIVRAWSKVHNLPDSHFGGNMWRIVIEYIQKMRNAHHGSGSAKSGTKAESATSTMNSPDCEIPESTSEASKPANVKANLPPNEKPGKETFTSLIVEVTNRDESPVTKAQPIPATIPVHQTPSSPPKAPQSSYSVGVNAKNQPVLEQMCPSSYSDEVLPNINSAAFAKMTSDHIINFHEYSMSNSSHLPNNPTSLSQSYETAM